MLNDISLDEKIPVTSDRTILIYIETKLYVRVVQLIEKFQNLVTKKESCFFIGSSSSPREPNLESIVEKNNVSLI